MDKNKEAIIRNEAVNDQLLETIKPYREEMYALEVEYKAKANALNTLYDTPDLIRHALIYSAILIVNGELLRRELDLED